MTLSKKREYHQNYNRLYYENIIKPTRVPKPKLKSEPLPKPPKVYDNSKSYIEKIKLFSEYGCYPFKDFSKRIIDDFKSSQITP
jgi:hypothetical protein